MAYDLSLSAFEAAWNAAGVDKSLLPFRSPQTDTSNFSRVQYRYTPLPPMVGKRPTRNWVKSNFETLVLHRTGLTPYGACPPQPIDPSVHKLVSESALREYQDRCTDWLAHSEFLDRTSEDGRQSTAEKVFNILCHRAIGNRENRKYLLAKDLAPMVSVAQERRLPLQFVVPSFPFKVQNPLRTAGPADHVDFGEVALLIRLHTLALAVSRVYPFGVEWIILSDGTLRASIVEIVQQEAIRYQARLRDYRNRLNLGMSVHIIDLAETVHRISGASGLDFESTQAAILEELASLVQAGLIEDSYAALARSMEQIMNTSSLLQRYEWCDVWQMLTGSRDDPVVAKLRAAASLTERSRNAALEYAASGLALKYIDVIHRIFPLAIRATVQPKPGQVAIPRLGGVFPWHGVAVMRDLDWGPASIVSRPLYEILSRPEYSAAYLEGGTAPFLYWLV